MSLAFFDNIIYIILHVNCILYKTINIINTLYSIKKIKTLFIILKLT
ncbi:hypothetical protein CLG_B0960 [Clostridium botulinum D str. 1873]|uniref:Uncharacterized protein n=1 Tax=Clostridium botulinum D str. 1873 TaxID=592027 RepID=A0A9P2LL83_CLOBO|nr:hypothetical protein CLG_B0960 [Clostridium botulinum D str. 1873]